MILPVHSDQLVLKLGMPWDGISPRYLTRAPKRLSLASEGTGRLDPVRIHAVQLQLFPEEISNGS